LGRTPLDIPPSLALLADGRRLIVWLAGTEQQQSLHLAQIAPDGETLLSRDLNVTVTSPRSPQLQPAGGDRFHLAFLALAQPGDVNRTLYHLLIDADGQPVSPLVPLVSPAADLRTGSRADGSMDLVWTEPGIQPRPHHARLDAQGKIIIADHCLSSRGFQPAIQTDRAGIAHLAWFESPRRLLGGYDRDLVYTTLSPDAQMAPPQVVSNFELDQRSGQVLVGPVIALDNSRVYLFWSTVNRGRERDLAAGRLISFPIERPSYWEATPVPLPLIAKVYYSPVQSPAFAYRQLALPQTGTSYVTDPTPLPGQAAEAIVFFTARSISKERGFLQLALIVYRDGWPRGYQVISRTPGLSLSPVAVSDANGDLSLVWLETSGENDLDVIYASTAAAAHARLDRNTPADVTYDLLAIGWRGLSGLSYLAMVFVWPALSFAFLLLAAFIRGSHELKGWASWLLLLVAIGGYLALRLSLIPPLPLDIAPPFREVITFISPTGGLLSLIVYRRRALRASFFNGFLAFVAVDTLLTLFVYLPIALEQP